MRLYFRSFRTRLIVFVAGLLFVVLTAIFIAVNHANIENAETEITRALEVGNGAFKRAINDRVNQLLGLAFLLSNDYAFKTTFATGDHDTILSAMNNHLDRLPGADIMMLVSLDGKIIADTMRPENSGSVNPWPDLVTAAEQDEYGEASSIVLINNKPHQMMVVPLLAPELEAWIFVGFEIDNVFVQEFKKIILTDVTVVHRSDNNWFIDTTTINDRESDDILGSILNSEWQKGKSFMTELGYVEFVTLIEPLLEKEDRQVLIILQRSMSEALKPYTRLNAILFLLFTIGLLISITAALLIARSVTRPVLKLAEGARNIEAGDYAQRVETGQHDELGMLASAFNNMAKGLAEKEKVRNLLGKVVSKEIADELLSKDIELGGEEREVTILFSDVRNFTSLCEGQSPQAILSLLNRYLTRVSRIIEENGGVVDKYIGDAVMALFGAPVRSNDDATRAIRASLAMCQALEELNKELEKENLTPIGIGIGINTANVVAGNMGSIDRLNYTVIGDGVNLASRLEGQTKEYGVHIIVSESTRDAAPDFVYRELDCVRVKGKQVPVGIYEPVGLASEIAEAARKQVDDFASALKFYRNREWDRALNILEELHNQYPDDGLYQLYFQRVSKYRVKPPPHDWDGVFVCTGK